MKSAERTLGNTQHALALTGNVTLQPLNQSAKCMLELLSKAETTACPDSFHCRSFLHTCMPLSLQR